MSEAAPHLHQLRGVDKLWHLERTALFRNLSTQELNLVANLCSDRIYARNEVVFQPNDTADSIFILNRGCVRASVVNDLGKEKILGIFQTGDVFGENLLGDQGTFLVQATAHQESWVSILKRDVFLRLTAQRPILALNLISILTQKLGEAREDIRALAFLDTETRVAQKLVELAEMHGKMTASRTGMVKLKISLSHEQLARIIGGNRPHISTIMSRFKKRGWIGYQGRKLLIDSEALKEAGRSA